MELDKKITYFDGDDIVLEFPEFLRLSGFGETIGGKGILRIARDVVLLGDVFRGDPHRDKAVGCFGVGKDRVGHPLWQDACAIVCCHVFDAGTLGRGQQTSFSWAGKERTDPNIDLARFDLIGDLGETE